MLNQEAILKLLAKVYDPLSGRDIVASGFIKEAKAEGGKVTVLMEITPPATPERFRLKEAVENILKTMPEVLHVTVDLKMIQPGQGVKAPGMPAAAPVKQKHPTIKYIIPVASGKGGVGKSTVSVNLALALAKLGSRVGLMDGDVYGPTIPTLLGGDNEPQQRDGKLIPPERFGIKLISMDFFLPRGEAVIWRGPMLHKTVEQFLRSVEWGELDYLVVDLPPGTGDVQLSLCQNIPLTGAVIVSTPQNLAFKVAEKAIIMFRKLETPVLGLVENMSGGLFGTGGVKQHAEAAGIPFLGEVPLSERICESSEKGEPLVATAPESAEAKAYLRIARNLMEQVVLREGAGGLDTEPLQVSQNSATELKIAWKDGGENVYKAFDLRAASKSADNMDEMTGARLVPIEKLDKNVRFMKIEYVGNYALKFHFSDGHHTGIYSFQYLRELARPQPLSC